MQIGECERGRGERERERERIKIEDIVDGSHRHADLHYDIH